jgi:hypothetical protein
MITTGLMVVAALAVVILGAMLGPILVRRIRTLQFRHAFGAEYSRAVGAAGSAQKAEEELEGRRKHIETLNLRPLSADERQRYQAHWDAVQARFVDQPGQATIQADRLIMEVMQLRGYPVSNFEQRAADLSVLYPALVSNYRAARATAIRDEQHHAGTEDLRLAMISYRSLFDELLHAKTIAPEKA